MNTLRARIAATLIVSILCVVGLATFVTIAVTRDAGAGGMADAVAGQLRIVVASTENARELPEGVSVVAQVPPGARNERFSRFIHDAFVRMRFPREVEVVYGVDGLHSTAYVETGDGRWLGVPVPNEGPPPDIWWVLGGWLSLILAGTTVVAVLAARSLTRPLALVESAASTLGPDGGIQNVPETGPAETRATARALNRMNRTLRAAVESRMRLVAAAGHDLRTPITRMRLRAEFLDEEEREKWVADLRELETIADSAIDLVREGVGDRQPQDIRLDHLAVAVATELADMGYPVRMEDAVPVVISGPRLALTRALRNLVVNAATHGHGAVVSVGDGDGLANLVIEDTGPGIPEALLTRVFEPFFRVDPARRHDIPGAGLGLAIAHEIVGRAGGTLRLTNREGGGLRQVASFAASAVVEGNA